MAIGVLLLKLVIDTVNDPGPDFFHFHFSSLNAACDCVFRRDVLDVNCTYKVQSQQIGGLQMEWSCVFLPFIAFFDHQEHECNFTDL